MQNQTGIRAGSESSVAISGAMTFDTVGSLLGESAKLFSEGHSFRALDLTGVERVDSSGLALLLEWQAKAQKAGYAFEVLHAPADLVSLAHLCEAQDLLKLESQAANGPRP